MLHYGLWRRYVLIHLLTELTGLGYLPLLLLTGGSLLCALTNCISVHIIYSIFDDISCLTGAYAKQITTFLVATLGFGMYGWLERLIT